MGFFQVTGFKEIKNMTVKNNLRLTINLYKKQYVLVITWNKNIYRTKSCFAVFKKNFFVIAILLKVCESLLFRQSKKTYSILRSVMSLLSISREEKTKYSWVLNKRGVLISGGKGGWDIR